MAVPTGKRSVARFIFVYLPLTIYILSVMYGMEQLSTGKPTANDEGITRLEWRQINSPMPLSKLTKSETSKSSSCKDGLVWIENKEMNPTTTISRNTSGIPNVIHQTARTRCITNDFAQLTQRWREWGDNDDWSYYFHDDEAMQRLVQNHASEFPNMLPIFQHCLLHGTARADLWRYLLLYTYGGVYADLDAVPDLLTGDMISNHRHQQHDALFVVEQYHMLSQYFMAVTPRHPIMWYALQHALLNVAKATDTGLAAAAMMTGPHALHQAYQSFRADVGELVEPAIPGRKPVWAGTFRGTNNRTVTVIGVAEDQNEYVDRDALGNSKRRSYKKLGMTFHQDDRKHASGQSCLHALLQAFNGF